MPCHIHLDDSLFDVPQKSVWRYRVQLEAPTLLTAAAVVVVVVVVVVGFLLPFVRAVSAVRDCCGLRSRHGRVEPGHVMSSGPRPC